MSDQQELKEATFGGGCFWCTEAVFQDVMGVLGVVPGYSGGHTPAPTYEQVCSGTTGHVEVIRVRFDPARVSYEQLLGVFFGTHDPTQLNRQGNDIGEQYRSVIFTHDDSQAEEARAFVRDLEERGVFDAPIVTAIEPLRSFHVAEDLHHGYFADNPAQPYCAAVIAPKVAQFRRDYAHFLRGSA